MAPANNGIWNRTLAYPRGAPVHRIVRTCLWFFGTVVAAQVDEITQQVLEGLRVLVEKLQAHPYGRYALAQVRDVGAAGATGWAGSVLAVAMRSVTRGLGCTGRR